MTIFNRYFGDKKTGDIDFTIPGSETVEKFGKVNIRKSGNTLHVQCTILMEPMGQEGEGWRTGIAIDCSASMKRSFGREATGSISPKLTKKYEKKGWAERLVDDGRKVIAYSEEAIKDAIANGYITLSENIVQPNARKFISYLAGNFDAFGGTTVIYWACGDGSKIEVLGDMTEEQCLEAKFEGPSTEDFGSKTMLAPAVKYFVDRFEKAKHAMYVFITDGRIDDLEEVKDYTIALAKKIEAGQRNMVKCVLIGVGEEVHERQLEELDNLETGTDVDIWDHKMAVDLRDVNEIFAELVTDKQTVANNGKIYASDGTVLIRYTDGVPAKLTFTMPVVSSWFELEVPGHKVKQIVNLPNV